MVMSIVKISPMNQNAMLVVQEPYIVVKKGAWAKNMFATVLSIARTVKMNEIAVRNTVFFLNFSWRFHI